MRLLTKESPFGWQWVTPLADAYVGTCLHVAGAHSLEELAGLADLVEPGGVVLDGGANLGALTLPLAAGGAKVVAVEPQALLLDCLVMSAVGARVIPAITPVHGALSDTEGGELHIPQLPLTAPVNFGGIGASAKGQPVKTTTVDALAAVHGPFSLVKLDLEGHEPHALRGATATLATDTVWCVEVDRDDATAAVLEVFQRTGHALYRWSPALEAPHAHVVSHNLLAVPSGKTVKLPVGAMPWA